MQSTKQEFNQMELTKHDFKKLALEAAKASPCKKRKVGAVVVDTINGFYTTGTNYNTECLECEDNQGNTYPTVVHAEVAAIKEFRNSHAIPPDTIYVTHQPCNDCLRAIEDAGILNVHVVEEFMKFDDGKLQYDLIPTSATEALAKVLTYGAKKYKPNNWRNGDIQRYRNAAFRHWEAYRSGEALDPESQLPHLEHLLTNVAFLIELEQEKSNSD